MDPASCFICLRQLNRFENTFQVKKNKKTTFTVSYQLHFSYEKVTNTITKYCTTVYYFVTPQACL